MENLTNIIEVSPATTNLNISPEGDFFRIWVDFLKPIHKLPPRMMDVLAILLQRRYELSKIILDPELLDSTLLHRRTRKEMRERIHMKARHFNEVIYQLRNKYHVMKGDKIYMHMIPVMTDGGVGLTVYFKWQDEQTS